MLALTMRPGGVVLTVQELLEKQHSSMAAGSDVTRRSAELEQRLKEEEQKRQAAEAGLAGATEAAERAKVRPTGPGSVRCQQQWWLQPSKRTRMIVAAMS